MKIKKSSLSAHEILDILDKYYLNIEDIKKVACVGRNKALEIRKEIEKICYLDNIKIPTGLIPADKLIDYLGINISYLKKCIAIKKDTTK